MSMLDVGEGHRLYVECLGRAGAPALVHLHGGPGSGASARQRGWFEGSSWQAWLFDQRGAGRSLPAGSIVDNDTARLVADIERIREHAGVDRWLVTGGSWGAALALAYAQRHPSRVTGLLLRASFLTGQEDIDWFFEGAGRARPQAHAGLLDDVKRLARELAVPVACGPFAVLAAGVRAGSVAAASAWARWERALGGQAGQAGLAGQMPPDETAAAAMLGRYRIQAHFLEQQCFLGREAVLQAAADFATLRPSAPVILLHGADDLVCRPVNASLIAKRMPQARLILVDGAGHDPFAAPMTAAIRDALAQLAADPRCR